MREVFDALSSGPATGYDVAQRVTWVTGDFRDFDLGMQGFAVRETLAHLEHGVVTGHIAKEMEDGLYRYRLYDSCRIAARLASLPTATSAIPRKLRAFNPQCGLTCLRLRPRDAGLCGRSARLKDSLLDDR